MLVANLGVAGVLHPPPQPSRIPFEVTVHHKPFVSAVVPGPATSVLMPFEFLKLPSTAVLAFLLFSELLNVSTRLGRAVTSPASGYIAHRKPKLAPLRAATATTGAGQLGAPPARPMV
jgi:hypothetical protein